MAIDTSYSITLPGGHACKRTCDMRYLMLMAFQLEIGFSVSAA